MIILNSFNAVFYFPHLGTGSNVCYIENVDSIEKWEDDNDCSKQVSVHFYKVSVILYLAELK